MFKPLFRFFDSSTDHDSLRCNTQKDKSQTRHHTAGTTIYYVYTLVTKSTLAIQLLLHLHLYYPNIHTIIIKEFLLVCDHVGLSCYLESYLVVSRCHKFMEISIRFSTRIFKQGRIWVSILHACICICMYCVVHLIRIYKSTQIIWIKGKFELQQHPLNSNFAHMNDNFELKG